MKTMRNGIVFDSIREADRYSELLLLEKSGLIKDLRLQVKFELIPKNGSERAVCYYADFTYTESGRQVAEDVKGVRTRDYIIKKKMLKWRYPDIQFREVD